MSLGRGLGALITATGSPRLGSAAAATTGNVWQVPLTKIGPNPLQPRRSFSDTELRELAASITHYGVLHPLLVSEREDGGYEIVSGERRYRAAKLAGLASVPVLVKKLANQEKLEIALVENIQRQDLNPMEEAYTYRRLMDEFSLTQDQVASRVGRARPTVANMVRLLDLPDEIQAALMAGTITMGQARALLGVSNPQERLELFASMQGQKITVRELERTVSAKRPPSARRRDPNLAHLEDQLRGALNAKAVISKHGDGGTITITYHSSDELGEIVEKIVE